jgi:hypothetical protein
LGQTQGKLKTEDAFSQSAPLDLCTDAFFPARRKLIESLLARVVKAGASLDACVNRINPFQSEHVFG